MPIIGWLAGRSIEVYIKSFDHWIALVLLIFVGGKMIIESYDGEHKEYRFNPSKGWNLVILSLATSIDALAVGLSLAFIGMEIWYPAVVIGLVTSGLSFAGILLGNCIGERFGKRIEFVGGLILCFIGIRIVIDHLFS